MGALGLSEASSASEAVMRLRVAEGRKALVREENDATGAA
jgi:hypothetical protein